MSRPKRALIFTLILFPFAAAGAYFAALMTVSSLDPAISEPAIEQVGSKTLVVLISTVQPLLLTLVCGFFGYILSDKTGLMRSFRIEKAKLFVTLLTALIGGAVFSLDAWTFAKWIPALQTGYENAGTFDAATWIASVLYGGVSEEIMMRLFCMSLFALIGWKLFFKKREAVPTGVFIAANILSAALFAAAHLPSTAMLIGPLTPLPIIRCFLLNGAFGLVFGVLYRKYGIQYAMLSHMLFHIVSRSIWLAAL